MKIIGLTTILMLTFATSLLAQDTISRAEITYPIRCLWDCSDTVKTKSDVICCSDLNITIRQVQMALNRNGYRLKVDGLLGKRTKRAWVSFIQKCGLPSHSIMMIFQALGIIKPM